MANFAAFLVDLYKSAINHLRVLHQQTDPIRGTASPRRGAASPRNYIFPLVASLCIVFYGTIILHYNATGSLTLNPTELLTSPYIFPHQMIPSIVWPQLDFNILLDTIAAVATFVGLLVTPSVKEQFLMSLDEQGCVKVGDKLVLDEALSRAILKQRKLLKAIFKETFVDMFGMCLLFLEAYVWYVNPTVEKDAIVATFWILGFPLYLLYAIYALLGTLSFCILASSAIRARQRAVHASLVQCTHFMKSSTTRNLQTEHLIAFSGHTQTVAYICQTTAEYSRYCVPFLSTLIPYAITAFCYLLYSVLFVDDVPILFKWVFIMCLLEVNLYLFVITHQCAQVAKGFTSLEAATRRFCSVLTTHFRGAVPLCSMLKIQSMQTYGRLDGAYGFRVAGDWQIDGDTYGLIITYISVFFIFVYKSSVMK